MNITISSESKNEYRLITSIGSLSDIDDLLKHTHLTCKEIIIHDEKKILINALETKFPLSLYPYFELVNHYTTAFPFEVRRLRVACVVLKDYEQASKFWENLCATKGFIFSAFTSLQDAHKWLTV